MATYTGTTGDDTLTGSSSSDVIRGDDGNDTLNGGAGDDFITGGLGIDTVDGGDGNDIIHGHSISESTIASILSANPTVVWNASTNSFYKYITSTVTWTAAKTAAEGTSLNGIAGHLSVITSATEQTYLVSLVSTDTWIGASDQTTEGAWLWYGGPEDGLQFWTGTGSAGSINNFYANWFGAAEPSGGGEDYAHLWNPNSYSWNDSGNLSHRYIIEWDAGLMSDDNAADILSGGLGNDTIYGYGGADILSGGDGNDLIIAGSGNDTVTGGNNNDALFGGSGDDTITGGAGSDVLDGGAGTSDTLDYFDSTFAVTVNLSTNSITGSHASSTANGDTISNFENVVGGSGNDTLTGSSSVNNISGGLGSDTVIGGIGSDILTGGNFNLTYTLANPTPATSDQFGNSVAVSGNYVVVGAWYDNTGAGDAGSTYIYNASTGALLWTLNNPTPAASDLFGASVAISGNYAVVGAWGDKTGATNAGSAYIYDASTGALLFTLNNPTPAVEDRFGYYVAVSGNYAIIGAYPDDTGAGDSGSAYVYNVTTGALLWTLNNPTPAGSDHFGISVAIDGNYAIVGAHYDNTGASDSGSAYIYDVTTGGLLWTLNNPTPAASDYFGYSVAISGNYAVVGAYSDDTGASDSGSVYVYDVRTGALIQTINNPAPDALDSFGFSVSISGNVITVGAYLDDTTGTNTGTSYIYTLDTTGSDTLDYSDTTNSSYNVVVNLATQSVTGSHASSTASGDTILGFENVTGGSGNDTLTGSSSSNTISGGSGNDTITGGSGSDVLDGGSGTSDTVDYSDSTFAVTVNLSTNSVTGSHASSTASGDTITGFENIKGGSGGDTLTGTSSANIMRGNDGNDTLNGDAGDDFITSGMGNDTVDGGDGNDIIHGHSISESAIASILSVNPNVVWNASTNSFYQYVTSTVIWTAAKTAAEGTSLNGIAGHLAVITSATEHTYLASLVSGSTWIGGSDQTIEGEWLWYGGPEDGLQFYQGTGLAGGINNFYTNWSNVDGSGDEAYLWQAAGYNWDDYTGNMPSYIIEWDAGLMSDDSAVDTLSGGMGDDTIYGYSGNDILSGDDGNDLIIAGSGNDIVMGGNNNDVLFGGSGTDTLDYRDTTNSSYNITVNLTTNSITGSHASSTAFGDTISGFENIFGGSGNDTITGTTGRNTIAGNGGNDTIAGLGGVGDNLSGGTGTDTIDFSTLANAVTITLSQTGSTGGYAVTNAQQTNLIDFECYKLSDYNDTFTGSKNNDTVFGSLGNDTMTGGLGADTVNYSLSTSAITINMVTNTNTGGFAAGDTLATIETLIATDYADTITGDSQNNIIYGGLQNDTINGGTGADILYGEDGDDTINGDAGNDKIYGSTGTNILNGGADNDIFYITSANNTETINGGSGLADVIDFSALTALVSINLSAGSISGGATNKTISNTENVRGTAYNDVITGDIFSNRLFGGNGNDTISGGINNDGLYGETGDDTLDGGLQNDILYGGVGIDNLTGGAGSDIFKYDVITESTTTNYDTITDFVIGTDKIDLALLVSDISGFGALTISNISGNTYSINDAAGSSFGLRATITGGTLSASDFVFG